MDLKKIIYYSTLTSIFTEALRYNTGFDLKYFYLVIFFNIIIFIASDKIVYNRGLLIFHSIIFFTGILSCIIGYNGLGYFLVQLFFLILIPTYYLSFFSFFKDQFDDIVAFYCKSCVVLAIIGFLKWPFDMSHGEAFHSLLLEPAHYCTAVLPAFFMCLKMKTFPRYYYKIILLSIILSGSSLGLIGLGLSIILYAKNISIVKTALASFLVVALGIGIYFAFPPFRVRMDDTVNSAINQDLSTANLSTYAFLSNLFVSTQSFISNPLFGNGIGSHIQSRSIYLSNIEGIEVFEKMGMDHLNAQDAGSLLSRLISEMGLVGVFGVFFFIAKFYVPNRDRNDLSTNVIISRAILLYFFAKLFREGHYFSPEMYFFVFMYVFNKHQSDKTVILNLKPINVK